MRTMMITAVLLVAALAGSLVYAQRRPAGGASDENRTTASQLETWMTDLSNWGRWGTDDERGALNLITPEIRRQALSLARTGSTVSLARLQQIVSGSENAPFDMTVTISPGGFAVDRIGVSFHGVQITHLDALCHFSHRGKTYNGYSFDQIATQDGGCSKLGNIAEGIVARGVLIDIPRLKGLPYLEPGTHVNQEDIEAWETMAGVRIGRGDAILLRTGRWARDTALGVSDTPSGYDLSLMPFLKARDVAVIGSDWTQDVGIVDGISFPVHRFAIVALGIHILDNLDLEALATKAADVNRWEFLLFAAPASAQNGTGAPINPLAVF